jgi:hypothetical protein
MEAGKVRFVGIKVLSQIYRFEIILLDIIGQDALTWI